MPWIRVNSSSQIAKFAIDTTSVMSASSSDTSCTTRETENNQPFFSVGEVCSEPQEGGNVTDCFDMELQFLDSDNKDPAALEISKSGCEEELTWEYHIMYQPSYQVPILYFQVWDTSGKPLPLDNLWNRLKGNFQGRLAEEAWSILTQQEHPILKRPFYVLHPCATHDLLQIFELSWNPIVSWLMTVGPTVGLTLCPIYGNPDAEWTNIL